MKGRLRACGSTSFWILSLAFLGLAGCTKFDASKDAYFQNRGDEEYQAGKFEEAIGHFSKAIELNPSNALAYANRCGAKMSLGENIAAEKDCDKAIELDASIAAALGENPKD